MKRNDAGYVLVYVMVVLLVFCLVATVILTGAMQNLQRQQDAITEMQDKYAAQGMIEKVVAQIENAGGGTSAIEIPKAPDGTPLLTVKTESGVLTLTARCGTVVVTGTYDMNKNYECIAYVIGGAAE